MVEMPRGWSDKEYRGFLIRKRTVGGQTGWVLDKWHPYGDYRLPQVGQWRRERAKTRKHVRVLVCRAGEVVNRFLTTKRAREWIRSQQ